MDWPVWSWANGPSALANSASLRPAELWKPCNATPHLSPLGLDGFPARLDQRLPLVDRLISLYSSPGLEEGRSDHGETAGS
jgi:hypothetical protein